MACNSSPQPSVPSTIISCDVSITPDSAAVMPTIDEDDDLDAVDPQPGRLGGLLIAADGTDVLTERRLAHHQPQDGEHAERDEDRDGHAQQLPGVQLREVGLVHEQDGLPVGDEQRRTTQDAHRAQGSHECGHAQARDDEAVGEADRGAQQQRRADAEGNADRAEQDGERCRRPAPAASRSKGRARPSPAPSVMPRAGTAMMAAVMSRLRTLAGCRKLGATLVDQGHDDARS